LTEEVLQPRSHGDVEEEGGREHGRKRLEDGRARRSFHSTCQRGARDTQSEKEIGTDGSKEYCQLKGTVPGLEGSGRRGLERERVGKKEGASSSPN